MVDRKKRRDVRINIPMVIDLLKEEGCPPDGVKDVLWRFPHILLLRPPLNKFFQGLIRYILTVKMEFIEPTPSVRQELFSWTSELRRSKHYGYLTVGKEMWLDSISFEWGPIDETWEYMFDMLLDFSLDTGHVNPEEGSQLAEWLQRQQARVSNRPTSYTLQGFLSTSFFARRSCIGLDTCLNSESSD